jgi:hypothetical protein
MAIAEQTQAIDWEHTSWEDGCAAVKQFTDRLGTPIDEGIFESVVVPNLLGLRTFQSCEGHLTHGCAYPWVSLVDPPLSGRFVRRWQNVCQLEEQAKAVGTLETYDTYLAEHAHLQVEMTQWEDPLSHRVQMLLENFYTDERQYTPSRLIVIKHHPGMMRLEPFFGNHMKSPSETLKSAYLTRGQAEMQAFTNYPKGH